MQVWLAAELSGTISIETLIASIMAILVDRDKQRTNLLSFISKNFYLNILLETPFYHTEGEVSSSLLNSELPMKKLHNMCEPLSSACDASPYPPPAVQIWPGQQEGMTQVLESCLFSFECTV